MRGIVVCLSICFALGLSACTQAPASINRSLRGSIVRAHSDDLKILLDALAVDASYGGSDVTFYRVAQAGFNFVDGQCVDYLDTLNDLDRKRHAAKRAFAGFGQTSNAIMAVTGASRVTLAVVAQAFGLADGLTDAYADSFLFSLPPRDVAGFVRKAMEAYRNASALNHFHIDSGPSAYREIQGYVRLCTPVTIESMLLEHITDATAATVSSAGGTSVVIGSRLSAEEKAMQDATTPLKEPSSKLPGPINKKKWEGTTGAKNPYEQNFPDSQLRTMQEMLCVETTGGWNAPTRNAIVVLYAAVGDPRPALADTGLSKFDFPLLQRGMVDGLKCGKDKKNKMNIVYDTVEKLATILQ